VEGHNTCQLLAGRFIIATSLFVAEPIELTDEFITPRSGLALFTEVISAMKVEEKVKHHFPKPGSNRGYSSWSYIEPLLLVLQGGGRHIEDLSEIRDYGALREVIGLRQMPSLSTYGD